MNLESVQIDPAEATARLAEYEGQIAAERTAEDAAICAGYRAAARGLPVISLRAVIGAGGFHDTGLPRLAIISAASESMFCHWDGSDLVYTERDDWRSNRGALVGASSVRVPVSGDDLPAGRPGYWRAGTAMVPVIPPRFRPRRRRLRSHHILWEVDSWTRVPPQDPALLRHIRGDLWAVLATWDLTELERLVLSQRAR
jgi:hypothetical protein